MTTLATYEDKPLLVDVLSRAFENNGSVRYVAGYGDGQMNRIRALMEYSVEICFHYGNIYLDSNRTACALILYPHRKRTTLRSVMLDVQLVLRAIGWRNIRRVLKREAQLKRIQPKVELQLKIGDFFYAANLSFSSSISSICLGVLYPRAECVLLVL